MLTDLALVTNSKLSLVRVVFGPTLNEKLFNLEIKAFDGRVINVFSTLKRLLLK